MRRCGCCGLRRECWPIQRYGGGTYRRGGRHYAGSICEDCITRLVAASTSRRNVDSIERYSVSSLRRLAALMAARDAGRPQASHLAYLGGDVWRCLRCGQAVAYERLGDTCPGRVVPIVAPVPE